MFSTSVASKAITEHIKLTLIDKLQIWAVDYSFLVLLIIGIFALFIGFLLLWNAFDIFVLLTKSGEKMSIFKPYRESLAREMKSAKAKPERKTNSNA
jgi:hypothetical protein